MFVSRWRFRCNAKSEKNVRILCNRFGRVLGVELVDPDLADLGGIGFVVTWNHMLQQANWNDSVIALLVLAQRAARRWTITGSVVETCSGWSNAARIAGIQTIEWHTSIHYVDLALLPSEPDVWRTGRES